MVGPDRSIRMENFPSLIFSLSRDDEFMWQTTIGYAISISFFVLPWQLKKNSRAWYAINCYVLCLVLKRNRIEEEMGKLFPSTFHLQRRLVRANKMTVLTSRDESNTTLPCQCTVHGLFPRSRCCGISPQSPSINWYVASIFLCWLLN